MRNQIWPLFGRICRTATGVTIIMGLSTSMALSNALAPPFTINDPGIMLVRQVSGPGELVDVESTKMLYKVFNRAGYRLEGVRRHGEVPRLFLVRLPGDLRNIQAPSHRKVIFIKTTLPLILLVNEQIERDRMRIQFLRALTGAGVELTSDDAEWLNAIAGYHQLSQIDFDELLRRVDIVPTSLALAQSAAETGWGTSRFAHEGNALFGQRIFGGKGGLVPRRRDKGKTFKVRSFDDLIEGVQAYVHNLNTFTAYEKFRRARETFRDGGGRLIGTELAKTLENYSERREAYIDTIQLIIRANELGMFDKARLVDTLTGSVATPDT